MRTRSTHIWMLAASFALVSCGGGSEEPDEPAAAAPAETAAAPAAAPAAEAPPPESTDTIDGTTLADFTGDPVHGETVFLQCKSCHSLEPGQNRIGPSQAGLIGREAGSVEGFQYSEANANSGITWTPEKLYQYLEDPQRVVPGTKMAFPGLPDGQDRADVIAYMQSVQG